MLFNINHYYSGILDRLDFVPEKSLKSSINWDTNFLNNANYDANSLRTRIRGYFQSAIQQLPLEKREEAAIKYVEFQQKYREFRIAFRPYINMIYSIPFMKAPGCYEFQDGDRYYLDSVQSNPDGFNKRNCDYYIIADESGGQITDYRRRWDRYQSLYKYNNDNKFRITGQTSPVYACKSSEGDRVYQSYNQNIADTYYSACENMTQSIKDLIIACEGYANNLQ